MTYNNQHVLLLWGAAGALITCSSVALAQDGDLSRCLAIPDTQERVACYDAIARAQASPPVAADDVATAALPPPVPRSSPAAGPQRPRAEFGLSPAAREQRLPTEQQQLEKVHAVIASARIAGAGYWEFTMQDGTVWRLSEVRRSFRAPQAGDMVELRRGSLGSYFLEANGQAGMRIKRVS